ncbi:MAG: hypothetical protein H7249_10995 [Chitinophagaceae bacterium]|nr:hypothetical protein [Oligoflexus sp.]
MRISSSLILITLLSLNASCGKWAKANHETVETMPRPTYPVVTGDVFSLDGAKPATSYKGTLFLSNAKATAVDFAALIDASVSSRKAWGAMNKFEVESDYTNLYSDNGLATQQVALMKQGLQSFELDALAKNPISHAAKLSNAETWIERDVATLGLSAEQKVEFDASWGEYCEAKIIEFAVHPALSQKTFKAVPSPAPLCSKYYADHSMFTSADCTTDSGDYLKCIWLDGVIKTRWFTSPNEATDAGLATAKGDKRTRLTALLSEANYAGTKGVLANTASAFVLTSPIYKKLYFDKKDAFIKIAIDQKTDASCVKVVANVDSQDLCKVFGLAPEAHSPRQVIAAVEEVTPNENVFHKLPAPSLPRLILTQDVIRYLQQRYSTETSEGDRLFLETKDGSTLDQPTYVSAGQAFIDRIPQIRTLLGAEFYGTFSDADNAERLKKANAIAYQAQLITDHRAQWNKLNDDIISTTDTGITVANRPGFAHGFFQYEMNFQQVGNILTAQFSFEDHLDYVMRACFDLVKNAAVDCPGDLPLKADTNLLSASLTRGTDGGKIEFAFKLSPSDAIGFGPKPRSDADRKPDFFMDLPTTETEGRMLRFELYRNRLDGHLDIMTGKAFVEANGIQYYEAALSMWEQSE